MAEGEARLALLERSSCKKEMNPLVSTADSNGAHSAHWQNLPGGPTMHGKNAHHHECFLHEDGVSALVCRNLSSDLDNNQTCVQMECNSPWRRCSSCVAQGTLEEDSMVVDPESGLCPFHIENGVEREKTAGGEKVAASAAEVHAALRRGNGSGAAVISEKKHEAGTPLRGVEKVQISEANTIVPPVSIDVPSREKEHTALEEAVKLNRMRQNMSVESAAEAFSRSVPWVRQRLSLLGLHEEVQKMLSEDLPEGERINTSIATALAGYVDKEFQLVCAREIVQKKMSHASAIAFMRRLAIEKNIATIGKRNDYTPKLLYVKTFRFIGMASVQCDNLIVLSHEHLASMFSDKTARQIMQNKLIELGAKINRLAELIGE